MQLTLDEATHTYRRDGKIIPSVHELLTSAGVVDSRWWNDGACLRGQYVAKATALDDREQLDFANLDVRLKPYIEGWRAFRKAHAFHPLTIEEQVCCRAYDYAGTLDRRGELEGAETIIDIKAGCAVPWHALQLMGYSLCFPYAIRRVCVYLTADGTYKVRVYDDIEDMTVWTAICQTYWWRKRHNCLEAR